MGDKAYLFLYRRSARSIGTGMMIRLPLIVMIAIIVAFCFRGKEIGWFMPGVWGLLAGVTFVTGLRRVLHGGEWGCFIDHEYVTWVYPHRMGRENQQIPVRNIKKFVEEIAGDGADSACSYFIETADRRVEIEIECFDCAENLRHALLEANPAIELETRKNGKVKPPTKPV